METVQMQMQMLTAQLLSNVKQRSSLRIHTCGAERVTHGDGTAVGVDLCRVQVQHVAAVGRL